MDAPGGIQMVQTFLRLPRVLEVTGMGRATLYAKIATKEFPRPVKLGPKAVAWVESEVADWQAARLADREKAA